MASKGSSAYIVPEDTVARCRVCTFSEPQTVYRYNNQILCSKCLDNILSRKFVRELKTAKCFVPGLYSTVIYNSRPSFCAFLYFFYRYTSHFVVEFSRSLRVICLPTEVDACKETVSTVVKCFFMDLEPAISSITKNNITQAPEVVPIDYNSDTLFHKAWENIVTNGLAKVTNSVSIDKEKKKAPSYSPLYERSKKAIILTYSLAMMSGYDNFGIIFDPADSATLAALTVDDVCCGGFQRAFLQTEVDQQLPQFYGVRDPKKAFSRHQELLNYPIECKNALPVGNFTQFHIIRPMKTISLKELDFLIDHVLVPNGFVSSGRTIPEKHFHDSLHLNIIEDAVKQSDSIECILSSANKLIVTQKRQVVSRCPLCCACVFSKQPELKTVSEEQTAHRFNEKYRLCKFCSPYFRESFPDIGDIIRFKKDENEDESQDDENNVDNNQ